MVGKIVIIGGGVAGLGAAYKLRRAATAGHDIDFELLEKDDRLGGKLYTDVGRDAQGRTYIADGGSDSYLTSKSAIAKVAARLGVQDEIVSTMDENKKTFIVKDGELVELPDGIMMFAPTKLIPMATTNLYSWPGKFRMALDYFLPRKTIWKEGETAQDHDESLESFVVRRMGRECLDRLAEPLVGGVNGSEPQTMSLAATYPNLLEMEQYWGSLIRGFLDQRKKVEAMKKAHPPKAGAKPRTFFSSFRGGLQDLTDALADGAGRDHLHTSSPVVAVSRTDAATPAWKVTLEDGTVLDADAVIVATEGWAASELLSGVDEKLGEVIGTIPCSSSATVLMGFEEADCPFDKNWHGVLSPMVEHRPVTGMSLVSSKWPGRAEQGTVLLRGFLGGPRDQAVLDGTDEELIELTRQQFVDLLGVKPQAVPTYAKVFRWDRGMPQYTLGHLDRVDEIERISGDITGLGIAGNAYRGVGVPNAFESGERAADKVLSDLGVNFAEDETDAVEGKRA